MRAAGTVVFYKNSVLLAKRCLLWEGRPVLFAGYWSIFTGSIEEGENPIKAAQRELEEETQIQAPFASLKYIKALQTDLCELTIYAYEAPELLIPVLNAEHTEYGWFSLSSLDNFPEKIDAPIQECILSYSKTRNVDPS